MGLFRVIRIRPDRVFSGDAYHYGVLHANSFELKHGIIVFEDVVQHFETVRYSGPLGSKAMPIWPHKELHLDAGHTIQKIVRSTAWDTATSQQTDKVEVYDSNGDPVDFADKDSILTEIQSKLAAHKQGTGYTGVGSMILLDTQVFQKNPEFRVDYMLNHVGCPRSFWGRRKLNCFAGRFDVPGRADANPPTKHAPEDLDKRLADFLRNRRNPRVLYRSAESDTLLRKHAQSQAATADSVSPNSFSSQIYSSTFDEEPGPQPSVLKQRWASPSLLLKQITVIRHFYGELYIVLTEKRLLAVYDKRRRVVYFVHEVKERFGLAAVSVSSPGVFSVALKKSRDDREFFKLYLFYFERGSGIAHLINKNLLLFKFVCKDLVLVGNRVYVVALKANFLGLVVYRFDMPAADAGPSQSYRWREPKTTLSIENFLVNGLTVENYQSNLQFAKLNCHLARDQLAACVAQFEALDSMLVHLKLGSGQRLQEKTEAAKIGQQADPKAGKTGQDTGATKHGSSHFKKKLFKMKTNRKITKHKPTRTAEAKEAQHSDKGVDTLRAKTKVAFAEIWSVHMLRNWNTGKTVSGFEGYFRGELLALVYQVGPFVRIYFYRLSAVKALTRPRIEPISACAKDSKYLSLFFRVEIAALGSRFLRLEFARDIEMTASASGTTTFEVVRIMKVIFNDRIETYRIDDDVKLYIKKKTLGTCKISLFAKNH